MGTKGNLNFHPEGEETKTEVKCSSAETDA